MNRDDDVRRAQAIVRAAREMLAGMLAGQGPDVQGAVLADLVSYWIAGHNPALRESAFQMWIDTVKVLIPVSEKQMFGEGGFPEQLQ